MRKARILALLMLVWLASPAGFTAPSAAPPTLGKGMFLVATPNLHGTSFERTVILLTDYSPYGAMGIAINRPTQILLVEQLPELRESQNAENAHLFLGGPVHPFAILFLTRAPTVSDSNLHVFDNVFIGGTLPALKEALTHAPDKEKQVQTYSGYAGWGPGQLEQELERGDWFLANADVEDIFITPTERVWEKLMQLWSGKWL